MLLYPLLVLNILNIFVPISQSWPHNVHFLYIYIKNMCIISVNLCSLFTGGKVERSTATNFGQSGKACREDSDNLQCLQKISCSNSRHTNTALR